MQGVSAGWDGLTLKNYVEHNALQCKVVSRSEAPQLPVNLTVRRCHRQGSLGAVLDHKAMASRSARSVPAACETVFYLLLLTGEKTSMHAQRIQICQYGCKKEALTLTV